MPDVIVFALGILFIIWTIFIFTSLEKRYNTGIILCVVVLGLFGWLLIYSITPLEKSSVVLKSKNINGVDVVAAPDGKVINLNGYFGADFEDGDEFLYTKYSENLHYGVLPVFRTEGNGYITRVGRESTE